jgi:hypothetical protein
MDKEVSYYILLGFMCPRPGVRFFKQTLKNEKYSLNGIEKLIITQVINKFPVFMIPKPSSPSSHKFGTYHEPVEFGLYPHALFL